MILQDQQRFVKEVLAAKDAYRAFQMEPPPSRPVLSIWTWLRHPFKSWRALRSYKEALRAWRFRALAASMTAPLRQRLDYAAVGRQCFQVQELPGVTVEVYGRDAGDPGDV